MDPFHVAHTGAPERVPHLRPQAADRRAPYTSVLATADKLVGTVVSCADPVLTERLAESFDYLWLDLEHGALSLSDIQTLAIAARAGGAYALVRLPAVHCESLTSVLDTGVDGIVAPRVSSPAEASELVELTSYPPTGRRGFAERRARRLHSVVNERGWPANTVARIVQIETARGVENVRPIAATPGIDALVVGTSDLSLELGCPLEVSAPQMIEAIRTVGTAAASEGKPWGIAAGGLQPWVREAGSRGATLLLLSSDVRLYSQALDERDDELRAWRTLKTMRPHHRLADTSIPFPPDRSGPQ
jgi:4-hydroxy-2-oxoheptanedioate aldolase